VSVPSVKIEIAFATDPDSSFPAYQDVSAYAMGFSVRRGRTAELDTVQSSTLDLRLRNDDRRFDPSYTRSPYYPNVLPMRKVRVSATWAGTTYYLFTGFVERWPLSWDGPQFGTVNVSAVDGLAALAQASIAGTFGQALTGARISAVLNAAAWPASVPAAGGYWTLDTSTLGTSTVLSYGVATTVIDAGQSQVQAVTIPDDGSVSALAHIQDIAAADRGIFFLDGQGRAVFHDRHHRFGATSLVTFTDNLAALDASHLPYQGLEPEFMDVARILNEVKVTRDGGTVQTATDAASRQHYLRRTLALTPPLTTDAEAMDQAQFELILHKDPAVRFTSMSVRPAGNDQTWPLALGLELSDKITVQHASGASASIVAETLTQPCFVEAISHTATADLTTWQTAWQLSPATIYGSFFTLDTAQLDSTANAALAY
jgi:hypothetical protein